MPNPNYVKGVKKERAIVNEARAKGLIAFRSAGSHSPIDVCIIDNINRRVRLIQCKPDDISDKIIRAIKGKYPIDGLYGLTFEVL